MRRVLRAIAPEWNGRSNAKEAAVVAETKLKILSIVVSGEGHFEEYPGA